MKKAVLIPIIVGGALLTSFVAFFVTGVVYNANTAKLVTNEYVVDNFSKLNVETTTANIEVRVSEEKTSKVICMENSKIPHLVNVEDGTLTIKPDDKRNWFDKAFSFTPYETNIVIYTSSTNFLASNFKASTGNIAVPKDFVFASLNVETSTGDSSLKCRVLDEYNVTASTGKVNVETIAKNLNITTSTGDITVSATLDNLNISASTGSVTLNNTLVGENLKIKTSTGDVTLNDSDASSIDIETSTGYVKGTLLTYKLFNVKTSTGKVNVPPSILGGNPCHIETSTGDITISIKE